MKMVKTECVMSLLAALAFASCTSACANDYSEWQPDTNLLASVEPYLKEYSWLNSDQRRELADCDIHIEVDNDLSNIVVQVPDVTVRDSFTIRGLAYTNYFRTVKGVTDGHFRYLEVQFSPIPLTNVVSMYSCRFYSTNPTPFKVYVDIDSKKVVHEWEWWGYRRLKVSD